MFLYSGLLKEVQIRYMMISACMINLVGAMTTLMYVKDITLGMSPLVFVVMTSTVTDTLYNAFTTLPAMVLFAKLVPDNIESSMFALLTGITNLANLFLSKELGVFINKFVGVNDSNLDMLWKLYAIQAGCCFLPIMFIWLLPNRDQVKLVQASLAAEVVTRVTEQHSIKASLIATDNGPLPDFHFNINTMTVTRTTEQTTTQTE